MHNAQKIIFSLFPEKISIINEKSFTYLCIRNTKILPYFLEICVYTCEWPFLVKTDVFKELLNLTLTRISQLG